MGLCNTTNPRGVSLKLIYSLAAMGAVWEALSREAAMANRLKPVALFLTLPERETLQALVRRRSTHQDVARGIPPSRAQAAGSQDDPARCGEDRPAQIGASVLLVPKAELWKLLWPMAPMRKLLADFSKTTPARHCYPSHPLNEVPTSEPLRGSPRGAAEWIRGARLLQDGKVR